MVIGHYSKPLNLKIDFEIYVEEVSALREKLMLCSSYEERTILIHVLRKQFQPALLKFLEAYKGNVHLVFYFFDIMPTILSRMVAIDSLKTDIPVQGRRKQINKQSLLEDESIFLDELINSWNMNLLPIFMKAKYLLNHILP